DHRLRPGQGCLEVSVIHRTPPSGGVVRAVTRSWCRVAGTLETRLDLETVTQRILPCRQVENEERQSVAATLVSVHGHMHANARREASVGKLLGTEGGSAAPERPPVATARHDEPAAPAQSSTAQDAAPDQSGDGDQPVPGPGDHRVQ